MNPGVNPFKDMNLEEIKAKLGLKGSVSPATTDDKSNSTD